MKALMQMKTLKGFTLIELLIVVAIIAILAAIAVPNFMEAQVRAKVTRCKSDMRTLTVGIQSYAVDYNRVPYDDADRRDHLGLSGNKPLFVITTPVAYISALLKDPFIEASGQRQPGSTGENIFNNNRDFRYKSAHREFETANPNSWKSQLLAKGYSFFIFSAGPSRNRASSADDTRWVQPQGIIIGAHDLEVYDSTNGTKSHGLIIRTNKNEYTGSDYVKKV